MSIAFKVKVAGKCTNFLTMIGTYFTYPKVNFILTHYSALCYPGLVDDMTDGLGG